MEHAIRRFARLSRRLALVVTCVASTAAPVAGETAVELDDPELVSIARTLAAGDSLRIEGVQVVASGEPSALLVERFDVLAPGARIVLHSAQGAETIPFPRRTHLKGTVEGDSSSLVVLSAEAQTGLRGWIATAGRWYAVRPREDAATPEVLEVDRTASAAGLGEGFCAVSRLSGPAADLPGPASWGRPVFPAPPRRGEGLGGGVQYAVDLAIDTDWEYFSIFGSVGPATAYAADLVAAASAIYERDISTRLQLELLILWTDPLDPWTVEGDLLEALYELGDYWHANHTDTERTVAHLVSGKTSLAGGIAYGGVLCSPDIFVNGHWAGGYAVSGSVGSSGEFRDVFVFSHELGHNFDSRHTHCYNGEPLPGDPEIDQCYSGDVTGSGHVCYVGATSVPATGGSIMSYCHLEPGGFGNINLWLGREGFYGVRSERVPAKMLQHVEEVASCLPDAGAIFDDGFESGDTAAWSTTVP